MNKNDSTNFDSPLNGIKCDVETCVFHVRPQECRAGNIHVGPTHAQTSHDTICSTFRCEEQQ